MTRKERLEARKDLAKAVGVEQAEQIEELAELGFSEARREAPLRLVASTEAMEKSGKTHFILTAPGPIGILDLDDGLDGVIEKFPDKVVVVKRFSRQLQSILDGKRYDADEMNSEWEAFIAAYTALLRSPFIATLGGDSWADAWELCKMAHFGTDDPKGAGSGGHNTYKWGPPKREFRRLMSLAKARDDINLVLTHRLKDEYGKGDKKTGKFIHDGFKEMKYVTDVHIRHFVDEEGEFCIEIMASRRNPSLKGLVLSGPEANFTGLAMRLFPHTKPSDWGDKRKRPKPAGKEGGGGARTARRRKLRRRRRSNTSNSQE